LIPFLAAGFRAQHAPPSVPRELPVLVSAMDWLQARTTRSGISQAETKLT
jgi:hypothetical protein